MTDPIQPDVPEFSSAADVETDFRDKLAYLLNCESKEGGSNTPEVPVALL